LAVRLEDINKILREYFYPLDWVKVELNPKDGRKLHFPDAIDVDSIDITTKELIE